jgi:hypothetical protein
MEEADGFTIRNVWLSFKSGPVLTAKNARNVRIDQATTASPAELFVRATGAKTEAIVLRKVDVSRAKRDVELSSDVKQGAVVIR